MPGVIISVDSKQFIEYFIHEEIMNDYYFVVISDMIKISDGDSIAKSKISILRSLIPATKVRGKKINENMTEYCNAYMRYLASPEIFPSIVTLVKAYLSGLNIVLICSDDEEKEMKILYLLSQYILDTFGITVFPYDYFRKHKKECMKIQDNLDDVIKVYESAVEWAKTHKGEGQLEREQNRTKEKLQEELKEMDSKELKKICKELDIVYDKSMSKKEIRKAIIKKVLKRMKKGIIVEKDE